MVHFSVFIRNVTALFFFLLSVDVFLIFCLFSTQKSFFHVYASVSSDFFLRNHLYNKKCKCENHELNGCIFIRADASSKGYPKSET